MQKKKDETAPIICRITINGKMTQFSTKIFIKLNEWNIDNATVIGKTVQVKLINATLEEIKSSLHRVYHEETVKCFVYNS